MKYFHQIILLSLFCLLLFFIFYANNTSNAQNNSLSTKGLGCEKVFVRNLGLGSYGPDVKQLQVFLKGKEDGTEGFIFGLQTYKAMQKLKNNLYSVTNSDGNFDPKTKQTVNEFCESLKTNGTNQLNSNLKLVLSTESNEFYDDSPIKINLKSNQNIETISISNFILDGATAASLRKISKDEYVLIINPNENSRRVYVQIEADSVKTSIGLNETASNEVILNRKVFNANNVNTSNTTQTTQNLIWDGLNIDTSSENVVAADFKNTGEFINYLKTLQPKSQVNIFPNEENMYQSFYNYNIQNSILGHRNLNDNVATFTSKNASFGSTIYEDLNKYLGQPTINRYVVRNEISSIYLILKFVGYLNLSTYNDNGVLPRKFDRAILGTESYRCNKILTFFDNKLFELYEKGSEYDFRLNKSMLLAYPKDAYNYWNLSCFVEEELEPISFPNGLFCCTGDVCNKRGNIQAINYLESDGILRQVKKMYSTDLSDVYVTNGQPNGLGQFPGIYYFDRSLIKKNYCGNYKRFENLNKPVPTERERPSNDAPW